jgi:hypothetical protein
VSKFDAMRKGQQPPPAADVKAVYDEFGDALEVLADAELRLWDWESSNPAPDSRVG